MSLKRTAIISAVLFILIFGALMAFGAWTVWYRSTGFREQFQDVLKPQKADYSPTPAAIVMTTGREPDVSTRFMARMLNNPNAPIGESLDAGKEIFLTYCAPCHGETGDGMGIMGSVPYLERAPDQQNQDLSEYLSGYLGYNPDVNLNFVLEEPDGELYYTITNGGEAIMPSFRDALSPDQRWDLVNYIKRSLGGQLGE